MKKITNYFFNIFIVTFMLFGSVFFASATEMSASTLPSGMRTDYIVGRYPQGTAFDNITNSIWVTSNYSNIVSKIDINTGNRNDYPVGYSPSGIAFDNVTNSVWVANSYSNTISKVNINDGGKTDYPVGRYPTGVAFDRVTNSVWVTNRNSNTVSKVNIYDGTKIDYVVGNYPLGIAFDKVTRSVWVANRHSNTVSKVNIFKGTSEEYLVDISPSDAAFDSVTNSVWVSNFSSGTVSKINVNTGTRDAYQAGAYPNGVVFDNITNSVWVTNTYSNAITKIDIYTGTKMSYPARGGPLGITFDNITNSVWVANSYENVVSKFAIGAPAAPSLPTISLVGNVTTTIEYGSAFTDPGATANDSIDGNITSSIQLAGFVDTFQISTTTLAYSVTNSRGLSATTTRAVIVRCAVNCYSNVLFLPGLQASRLYRPDYNGGTDQLWEPTSNADAEDLLLDANGKSVREDVYTKDIIGTAYLPIKGNIYSSFIEQMNELKTAGTITDWKATPYDWRLSLEDILNNGNELSGGRVYFSGNLSATSSPYIIQELRRLAKTSKTGKVTIIAHSNGGLVAKALTDKLGNEASKLIDKIIFVAVPQVGTPQALGAILHGYDQGLVTDALSVFLSESSARMLAENMSSAYNLLPSESYFTSVSDPIAKFEDKPVLAEFRARYGDAIRSRTDLRTFLTDSWRLASSTPSDLEYPSVGNTALLSRAETAHATLDLWNPPTGVQLYEIAGWGEDTLATVQYYEGKKTIRKEVQSTFPFTGTYWKNVTVPAIMYKPNEVIDGDGTVVTASALWTANATTTGKWWVDLRKYDRLIYGNVERKHADILEVPALRALIQSFITTSPTAILPTSPFISTFQPDYDPSDLANKRLSFLLHSPLRLSVTDNLGNITNFATITIPGSRFTRYGEVQVLKVPKGTPVTLNLSGYASGSFTLDVEELDGLNNITAFTTFTAIPSSTSTTATISFAGGTLETATPLLVDYDGNGRTDFTLHPTIGKEVVFDATPPEARISFSTTTKSILIEGIDESFTTVQTTGTSTLIADESSNTLQLIFKKLNQENHQLKLELSTLAYNGISTSTIPKTTLQYEWSTDKVGDLKELEQKITVGNLKIEAHYDAKNNMTRIDEKIKGKEDKEKKKILTGLVVIRLSTDKGKVGVSY